MIVKGGRAGNVSFWSTHLQREDTNDRAELMEISGLLATDLPTALREMEAIGAQSRSKGNFLYQANINPRGDERLTPEQWKEAVDTLEKNLGFEGHQRVVVEHEKEGRVHRHVIWNRVDVETLRVADITNDYKKHRETSRELENRFELTPTPSPSREQKPDRAPDLWEIRAIERGGMHPDDMRKEITDLWRSSDSGKAFAAALDEKGYILAQGDRRDFCIVDQAGTAHSLARRIEDVKAQDVREHMADIERENLPTVAQARATQRGDQAHEANRDKELKGTAGEIRLAWSLTDSGPGFANAIEDRGMILARVTPEEALASQRAHDYAKELGRYSVSYREGELIVVDQRGGSYQLNSRTTGDNREQIEKRLATVDHASLPSVTDASEVMKEFRKAEFIEKKHQERQQQREQQQRERPTTDIEYDIKNCQRGAKSSGAFAASLYREGITITRVDTSGIEQLLAEHNAAFQNDRMTVLPYLKEGELVALNDAGRVHRLNPQKLDLRRIEDALTQGIHGIPAMGAAREYLLGERDTDRKAKADKWQDSVNERAESKRVREGEAQEKWADWRKDHIARKSEGPSIGKTTVAAKDALRTVKDDPIAVAKHVAKDVADSGLGAVPAAKAGLSVLDKATGALSPLASVVDSLLGGRPKLPPEGVERIRAQRRALAALENIAESMERGENLTSADVASLTPSQLMNIKGKGDDGIRELIENLERRQERERDYSRSRER